MENSHYRLAYHSDNWVVESRHVSRKTGKFYYRVVGWYGSRLEQALVRLLSLRLSEGTETRDLQTLIELLPRATSCLVAEARTLVTVLKERQ